MAAVEILQEHGPALKRPVVGKITGARRYDNSKELIPISGKGIHKAVRTIKHSKVATIKPRLTASGKRLYRGRKAIRLRVSFDPAVVGQQAMSTTTVVKRAKKASSSTRGHRSSRTR